MLKKQFYNKGKTWCFSVVAVTWRGLSHCLTVHGIFVCPTSVTGHKTPVLQSHLHQALLPPAASSATRILSAACCFWKKAPLFFFRSLAVATYITSLIDGPDPEPVPLKAIVFCPYRLPLREQVPLRSHWALRSLAWCLESLAETHRLTQKFLCSHSACFGHSRFLWKPPDIISVC